jgi:hypothetical protein
MVVERDLSLRLNRPLQNRVTPLGVVTRDAARGTLMGNRGGVFHRDDQTLKPRHWASKQWICCVLEFKGRRRTVMSPRRYTELFFLDDVTALAAGHRPCFECRRADALRFAEFWSKARGLPVRSSAPEMDAHLHLERSSNQSRKFIFERIDDLPDGTCVEAAGGIGALCGGRVLRWTASGYQGEFRGQDMPLKVLTPPSIVETLKVGYRPTFHGTAASHMTQPGPA